MAIWLVRDRRTKVIVSAIKASRHNLFDRMDQYTDPFAFQYKSENALFSTTKWVEFYRDSTEKDYFNQIKLKECYEN